VDRTQCQRSWRRVERTGLVRLTIAEHGIESRGAGGAAQCRGRSPMQGAQPNAGGAGVSPVSPHPGRAGGPHSMTNTPMSKTPSYTARKKSCD
jgi:hypothetical protein